PLGRWKPVASMAKSRGGSFTFTRVASESASQPALEARSSAGRRMRIIGRASGARSYTPADDRGDDLVGDAVGIAATPGPPAARRREPAALPEGTVGLAQEAILHQLRDLRRGALPGARLTVGLDRLHVPRDGADQIVEPGAGGGDGAHDLDLAPARPVAAA